MKRTAALFLILLLAVPAFFGSALQDPVFLMLDDQLLSPLSEGTMPVLISGQYYVPYTALEGMGGVKCYYNEAISSLIFFTFDLSVTFDLKNDLAFDEENALLSPNAVRRSGTVFVPVRLLSEHFGWYCSVVRTSLAPVVRVCGSAPARSDDDAVNLNSARMRVMYNQYTAVTSTTSERTSTSSSRTGTTSSGSTTSDIGVPRDPTAAYLLFDGMGPHTSEALSYLYGRGVSCAVFVTAEEIPACREELRRALCQGHVIGLRLDGESDVVSQLERGQIELRRALMYTTRTVLYRERDDNYDSLQRMGYNVWQCSVDAYDEDSSVPVWSSIYLALSSSSSPESVRLVGDENCLFTVMRLESMSVTGSYRFRPPCLWVSPVSE